MPLPTDAAERKNTPIYSGVLKYFPDAIAYVAKISKAGNDQHNPGQPLHWSRGKSGDHHDCAVRHLLESGDVDPVDGLRHSGKLAWRALAILQLELEEAETKDKRPLVPSDNPADVRLNDNINRKTWLQGGKEVIYTRHCISGCAPGCICNTSSESLAKIIAGPSYKE